MQYIQPNPTPSGAYPGPQSTPFPGAVALTDEQSALLVEYSGFVTITATEDGLTVVPNPEARDAWLASLPEPEEPVPTASEQLRADVDFLAAMAGVSL